MYASSWTYTHCEKTTRTSRPDEDSDEESPDDEPHCELWRHSVLLNSAGYLFAHLSKLENTPQLLKLSTFNLLTLTGSVTSLCLHPPQSLLSLICPGTERGPLKGQRPPSYYRGCVNHWKANDHRPITEGAWTPRRHTTTPDVQTSGNFFIW